MFKKRAQAAMEFLLTYGWAILVVLVVIGALAYFGVLNPSKLLPGKCLFGPGIGTCDDYAILIDPNSGKALVAMEMTNGFGQNIGTLKVENTGDLDCTNAIARGGVLQDGASTAKVVDALKGGGDIIFNVKPLIDIIPESTNKDDDPLCAQLNCASSWKPGEKIAVVIFGCDGASDKQKVNQAITLTYTYGTDGLTHTVSGDISDTAQSLS